MLRLVRSCGSILLCLSPTAPCAERPEETEESDALPVSSKTGTDGRASKMQGSLVQRSPPPSIQQQKRHAQRARHERHKSTGSHRIFGEKVCEQYLQNPIYPSYCPQEGAPSRQAMLSSCKQESMQKHARNMKQVNFSPNKFE
jgi:hypothetical protein